MKCNLKNGTAAHSLDSFWALEKSEKNLLKRRKKAFFTHDSSSLSQSFFCLFSDPVIIIIDRSGELADRQTPATLENQSDKCALASKKVFGRQKSAIRLWVFFHGHMTAKCKKYFYVFLASGVHDLLSLFLVSVSRVSWGLQYDVNFLVQTFKTDVGKTRVKRSPCDTEAYSWLKTEPLYKYWLRCWGISQHLLGWSTISRLVWNSSG